MNKSLLLTAIFGAYLSMQSLSVPRAQSFDNVPEQNEQVFRESMTRTYQSIQKGLFKPSKSREICAEYSTMIQACVDRLKDFPKSQSAVEYMMKAYFQRAWLETENKGTIDEAKAVLDFQHAEQLATTAIQEGSSIDMYYWRGYARTKLGWLRLFHKEYDRAESLFEAAMSDYDQGNGLQSDKTLDVKKGTTLMYLAITQFGLKHSADAEKTFLASVSAFDDGLVKDPAYLDCLEGKALCLIQQARVLHRLGKLAESAVCLKESLSASERICDIRRTAGTPDLVQARHFAHGLRYEQEAKQLLVQFQQ
jgi:tetratricopeptide (TPR) repeat protein